MTYTGYTKEEIDQKVEAILKALVGVTTRVQGLESKAHEHVNTAPTDPEPEPEPTPTPEPAPEPSPTPEPTPEPSGVPTTPPHTAPQPGPSSAPAGAVRVDPAVVGDLIAKTKANPAGTTFWLAPGVHTFGTSTYAQVIPRDGNVYLGAPGAVIDGKGVNRYCFTQRAQNVTVKHLEVRGFIPPGQEGVVNHDSGDGWTVEHCYLHHNKGAALMSGSRQVIRYNKVTDNDQYFLNAYKAGGGPKGVLVEGNEIARNGASRDPGQHGGVKFWEVNGCDVRDNWVHHNYGTGLWGDNNNNDFLIEHNLIEDNDGEALFYETSYNLIFRNNMIRRNTWVEGKQRVANGSRWPLGSVYISEAGGEPRIPARTSKIDVYGNVLEDNWAGITCWENADRFANSAADTSGTSTLLVAKSLCVQPGIASKPLYSDCRWKTQNVDVHDNEFRYDPTKITGYTQGYGGTMALFSNWGTYPDWSPYHGNVIQKAITFEQNNRWRNNRYTGPWRFFAVDSSKQLTWDQWRSPLGQDTGSTLT